MYNDASLSRAAYKGFADTIRLLLFRDADQRRQDKDGTVTQHFLSCRCMTEGLRYCV